jgi:hypothetical protein
MADAATAAPPDAEQAPPAPVAAPPPPSESPNSEPAAEVKAKGAKKDGKASKDAKGAKAGKGKGKGGKGGKGGKEDNAAEAAGDGPSVAAHPRAARAVARAKGWGGLLGFVLGGYLSLPTNTLAAAGLRALAAGVICYVAAWAGAVFLWRRLVMLEIKSREQQLIAAANAAAARRGRELPPGPPDRAGARAA